MKLTREQELYLIELGIQTLVGRAMENHSPRQQAPQAPPKTHKAPKRKRPGWTDAQRAKFKQTMLDKFGKDTTAQ